MDELPWVKAGDTIFKSDEDWQNNACLGWGGGAWLYGSGFYQGAVALAERVIETHSEQDFLVYPIVFNYRQFVELRLKEGVRDGNSLVGRDALTEDAIAKPLDQHALKPLWNRYRFIVSSQWPDEPQADLDAAECIIWQFDAVDRGSYAFRFPTTKKGKPFLPQDLIHINVRNLREVMERLSNFLDSYGDVIREHLDIFRQMEAELRGA